ncbi:MAG: hypothetical protein WCK90_05495, partial [archaeon]
GTIDVQYFNKSVDIFSRCDLDKLLFATGSDFFFKFELYMDGKSVLNRSEGRAEIEKDCELTKLSKNYPRCVNNSEEVLVLYPELRKAELKVLVGSNQFGGRLTPANNGA